jgi:hypothetical protein
MGGVAGLESHHVSSIMFILGFINGLRMSRGLVLYAANDVRSEHHVKKRSYHRSVANCRLDKSRDVCLRLKGKANAACLSKAACRCVGLL